MVFLEISVAFVLLWVVHRWRQMNILKRNGIPGPPPNFFFGNIVEFTKKGTNKCFAEWKEQYGPIVGFYLGGTPHVMVTDVELLKKIQIKDFHLFSDRNPFVKGGMHPSNYGQANMIWKKGAEWKENRAIITPTFNGKKLRMMTPVIDSLIDQTRQTIDKLHEVGVKEFDIYPIYKKMALEIIASNAFGIHMNKIFGSSSGFDATANKILKAADAAARPQLTGETLLALNIIFPEFTFIIHPIRKLVKTILEYLEMDPNGVLFSFCAKILRQRRETGNRRSDLLQSLMDAKLAMNAEVSDADLVMTSDASDNLEETHFSKDGKQLRSLEDKEVVSSAFLFLLAGYETTSTALAYLTHMLINHPKYQEQLRDEAAKLREKEGTLDYNTVNELPLMSAFIDETLRLHPPVAPFTTRLSTTDYKFKSITIPKGCGVYVGVNELQTDAGFWEKPDQFDPTRFLGENKAKSNSIMFQPFGFGPRNCIGMRFALLEIKLCLAKLLTAFNFEASAKSEMGKIAVIETFGTIVPKNGVFVRAVPLIGHTRAA